MNRVFFENVRCFSSRQDVPLAPLTVLVGENSSGKSTVLALVRLAWDMALKLRTPDFNEEPFLLGAYDQISSVGGASDSFKIGIEVGLKQGEKATFTAMYSPRRGQPALTDLSWDLPPYRLLTRFKGEDQVEDFSFEGPVGRLEICRPFSEPQLLVPWSILFLPALEKAEGAKTFNDGMLNCLKNLGDRPYAFAPIRTRPLRTYDPIKSLESPEGSHVPMILASTLLREPEEWKDLIQALDSFGQLSGLFGKVEVRRLGPSESDPFQIRVHVGGSAVNLIDVGYGVSQVLPIVVDSLRGKPTGTFLLQQPEVHLHPKAQAELGSFLGTLAKKQEKRFVIETHSDYLVDRIRMDIRDQKNGLRPEDVSLLYFERRNGEAQIHRLELDDQGNILNAPPGYRSFFLEEERRFLGG